MQPTDRKDTAHAEAGSPESIDKGYEVLDTATRPIIVVGIGLVILVLISLIGAALLMGDIVDRHLAARPELSPLAQRELPPYPRLQPSPPLELAAWRAGLEGALNSYGWIDSEEGLVRIPVDRAIALVAERGLPSWQLPADVPQVAPTPEQADPESGMPPSGATPGGPAPRAPAPTQPSPANP